MQDQEPARRATRNQPAGGGPAEQGQGPTDGRAVALDPRPEAAGPRVDLPSTYDPSQVEQKWYRFWEEGGFFKARPNPGKTPFTIVIPPPNVTGSLHMGHALDCALQDTLTRWHRMRGDETLWLPGSDHAGIATQHVVEMSLAQDGVNREEIGREEFIRRVWEWKAKYGDIIITQLKHLGASCDWDRLRFTMDEGCSRAVRQVFVGLHRKGLVFRDNYIINWCPQCKTALSDLEVEYREVQGHLYYVRYALEGAPGAAPVGGSGGSASAPAAASAPSPAASAAAPPAGPAPADSIMVATTRPETILGDTGVAVHPSDARYRQLVGRAALLPLMGRRLPIVADPVVDPEFGTGAVKITPAHDPTDFEVGRRHGLDTVVAIDAGGRMTEAAGSYAGQDRYECREALLRDLERAGHLVKVEDYTHAVGHCYRCDTAVEPRLSLQWFVRMKPLAEPAIKAVQEGRVRFVPERFTRVFTNWLENIKDWCISRQIWWGHRIPAWYCADCGHTTVAEDDPQSCEKCRSPRLERDPDVLDTWFSSALWPFSTLGWPDRTADLDYFYPTSVLVTAYDIIFFWVARMVFMGLEFMDREPFRHVLIHGLVRDEQGERMSKSRGTGIDPLDAVGRVGADALRLGLLMGLAPGNDLRFRWQRLEGSRNFCNKLWNAGRFALGHLREEPAPVPPEARSLADRWILSRLERTRAQVEEMLERFDLGEAARLLCDFFRGELCDWYLEFSKGCFFGREGEAAAAAARRTLWEAMDRTLRLLHPFVPFITEEVWQHLPHRGPSLMVAEWPRPRPEDLDLEAEAQVGLVVDVTRAIRNLRAEVRVPPQKPSEVLVVAPQDASRRALSAMAGHIRALAGAEPLRLLDSLPSRPRQALAAVVPGAEVYLPLEGLVDVEKETARLRRELALAEADHARSRARLDDPGFRGRAPAEVVEREEERETGLAEKARGLRRRLEELGS